MNIWNVNSKEKHVTSGFERWAVSCTSDYGEKKHLMSEAVYYSFEMQICSDGRQQHICYAYIYIPCIICPSSL